MKRVGHIISRKQLEKNINYSREDIEAMAIGVISEIGLLAQRGDYEIFISDKRNIWIKGRHSIVSYLLWSKKKEIQKKLDEVLSKKMEYKIAVA